ncbi:ribonuclease H protein [Tanacetum coccineum]|uniref:Ribonuclease H protein n=1 Tax=Tanacetum coccineum TaxID=301880 RepID=A0ABQ5CBA3_9ASTR
MPIPGFAASECSSTHPLNTEPKPPSPSTLSGWKFLVAFLSSLNVKLFKLHDCKISPSVRGETFSASSPLMAELYAIRNACRLAVTNGWQNAVVESDSKVAISLACAQVDPPWSLSAIVVDIKVWASQSGISFSWVKRDCNLAAHQVAKLAFRSHENFVWNSSFPDVITSVVRSDMI